MLNTYATLVSLVALPRTASSEEKGATAVEYGLMVGLIAVVIIAAVTLLGNHLKGLFESISGSLTAAHRLPTALLSSPSRLSRRSGPRPGAAVPLQNRRGRR